MAFEEIMTVLKDQRGWEAKNALLLKYLSKFVDHCKRGSW